MSVPKPPFSQWTVLSDGHTCVLLFLTAFAMFFSLVAENGFVKRDEKN